jgi:hypothetical protein
MNRQIDADTYKDALLKNVMEAIFKSGQSAGSRQFIVDTGAVTFALVEIIGHFAAMHRFDRHSRKQFVEKVGADLLQSIERHKHNRTTDGYKHIIREEEVN